MNSNRSVQLVKQNTLINSKFIKECLDPRLSAYHSLKCLLTLGCPLENLNNRFPFITQNNPKNVYVTHNETPRDDSKEVSKYV